LGLLRRLDVPHPQVSEPRSPGELLLAAYLRDRGLAFDFEPLVEGAHPDFVVEHPVGRLVLDVFEPELRLTDGGWVDPYAPLRRIFESRKRHQASAAARSGLPFVHVLAETNMAVPIETMFLVGALFGDIQVQVPPGPGGFDPAADARFGTGRNRRLQPTMNTSVSAVAVVRAFNPTLAAFERRAHDSLRAPDDLDGAAV